MPAEIILLSALWQIPLWHDGIQWHIHCNSKWQNFPVWGYNNMKCVRDGGSVECPSNLALSMLTSFSLMLKGGRIASWGNL